jgi:hypothetical protein
LGVRLESLILQISAERDRSDREKALVAQGALPIIVFANGPDSPFLVAARREDLDAAFAASEELSEGLGAERLARRMRVFDALSFAIETDMKFLEDDQSQFPNDALFMMVEGLHQVGLRSPNELRPCAVRFDRTQLDHPFYGEPPPLEGEA